MRKLFLAICFILGLGISIAHAASQSVSNIAEAQNQNNKKENSLEVAQKLMQERQQYRNMSPEQMQEYLKKRLYHVVINELDDSDGLGGDGAVNIQKSAIEQEMEAQSKKSIFEKIYDQAMNNLIDITAPKPAAKMYTDGDTNSQNMRPQAAIEQEQAKQRYLAQKQAWQNSNVNMIEVALPPFNHRTLMPAKEHIPYLFSRIELLPDGLVKFTDTIVVVANGQKVKDNVTRIFPKFIVDREGQRQKVEFNLLNVSVNGNPVEYKLSDRNNYIFMEPSQKRQLAPGVYEYQFDYTIDNQIFSYDEFDEFYWNLTGSMWNLVITRAGAAVILPPNTKTLGQTAISGYNGYWRDDTTLITQEQDNVLGFVSQTPLFNGQALNMIISLPKGAVSNISWSKRFLRLINAYGDVIFSTLGFLAILLSYLVSWKYIRNNKKASAKGVAKDAPLLRFLNKGVIDKKSFGAFLLDLYRKNIIDIEENDDNILLVKKTDNLASLSQSEKKAVNALFSGQEAILNVNSFSMLKITRAFDIIKKAVSQKIKFLNFKLNIGYLIFSIGMLLITEAFIALLNYNFTYNFIFLLLTTVSLCFCLWLCKHRFDKKWKKTAARCSAGVLFALTAFIMLAIVNLTTILLLCAILWTIWEFSSLYAQRDGLLAAYVNEAQTLSSLLQNKVDAIGLGKDFLKNQPAILALDCESFYTVCEQNKNVYKLDIITKLLEKI